jgi:polyisoprenoid-binding protein YceI
MFRLVPALLATGLACASATPLLAAEWTLDPARSHLSYVSIKAGHVGEVNHFTEIDGQIDGDGQVVINTALDSVETLIPIRNERMREILFKTAQFSDATLSAKIDPAQIAAMQPGDSVEVVAESTLSLHGAQQPLVLKMQVAKLDADTIMVASTEPVVLDAGNFGLTEGIEQLREIAGLESISRAVPVSFVITFDGAGADAGADAATGDSAAATQPSVETLEQYRSYRAIVEAMSSEQKEAVAALFGAGQ